MHTIGDMRLRPDARYKKDRIAAREAKNSNATRDHSFLSVHDLAFVLDGVPVPGPASLNEVIDGPAFDLPGGHHTSVGRASTQAGAAPYRKLGRMGNWNDARGEFEPPVHGAEPLTPRPQPSRSIG